ncbi:MAG: thioredoxin domain-containing protein [Actinomycetales bacterium]
MMPPRNGLSGAASAYLRQHAGNPVDWRPFGDEAFAEAARRDVPVFLSVGYAACHWCHVMAGESFEDEELAGYLNARFVAVKVDREERPDVDAAYMAATQALTGEGGWPMSVFLAPDGRAFYAGTYFPPVPLPGRPSFRQVLQAVSDAWTERRDQVLDTAGRLAAALGSGPLPLGGLRNTAVDDGAQAHLGRLAALEAACSTAVATLGRAEDPQHGGFGTAPKFPPSPVLEFLIRHAATGGKAAGAARGLAARAMAAMADSALYDQLEGGFARYSVTADWSLPHFEKMLYDNAALLGAYTHWLRLEPGGDFPPEAAERVVRGTASWVLAALRLPGGAFASSLDADTVVDGVHAEGATYLWTRTELAAAGAQELATVVNVGTKPGPLHPGRPLNAAEREAWDSHAARLRAVRAARAQPELDGKVVAGWNGAAIGALADAAAVLGEPALLAAAVKAAGYLQTVHWDGAVLRRISHDGTAVGIGGLLEDYAGVAKGLFSLYAATGQERWYSFAQALVAASVRIFVLDTESGAAVVDMPPESEQVLRAQGGVRGADPLDNATASAISVFAQVLLESSAYSGSAEHRRLAEELLAHAPVQAGRAARAAGGLLSGVQALLAGPLQLAVLGPPGPEREAMVNVATRSAIPGLVIAFGDVESGVPLLAGRSAGTGTRAYLCRGMVCRLPADSAAELAAQLAAESGRP